MEFLTRNKGLIVIKPDVTYNAATSNAFRLDNR